MGRDDIVAIFDEERAGGYDAQMTNVEAMHDALVLGMRLVLFELPPEARILCVGAGTGTEIVALAKHFPRWSFTAVEPAPAMMARCRAKITEAGLSLCCRLHEGYLDTLSDDGYDAATCLLVSHFFPIEADRVHFFAGIGARLRPGGLLVSADLSASTEGEGRIPLMDSWIRFMQLSGSPVTREGYEQALAGRVGLLLPSEMERVLEASGFSAPTAFFRMLMIGAWFSRWRASGALGE